MKWLDMIFTVINGAALGYCVGQIWVLNRRVKRLEKEEFNFDFIKFQTGLMQYPFRANKTYTPLAQRKTDEEEISNAI